MKVEREDAQAGPSFVPAIIEPEPAPPRSRASGAPSGRIEIVLSRCRRVIVDAGVDIAALRRVLDVLGER